MNPHDSLPAGFPCGLPALMGGGGGGLEALSAVSQQPDPNALVDKAIATLTARHLAASISARCASAPPHSLTLFEFRRAGRESEAWHWLALAHGGDRRAMDAALRDIHEAAFED